MSLVKRSVSVVLFLLVVGCSVWVWANRQYVQDWHVVQSYTPTSEIAAIAGRAGMNEKGRFLFYASTPILSEADDFNQQCTRREATSAILGCYNGQAIYLYRIDNPELDGIKEVTAAHEMLHAAWDRLSDTEQGRIEQHLEQVYTRIKTDELEERMAYYERQQPGERANELHSILATEVVELDDVLEEYYRQYFVDRQIVVALHAKYESVFSALKQQSEQLRQELEEILRVLNADIATYNAAVTALEAEITAHNSRLHTIDVTNQAAVNAYNAAQVSLTARQAQLDRDSAALDRRQNEYQQKVQAYNDLTVRSETLTNSMDSLKTPPVVTE